MRVKNAGSKYRLSWKRSAISRRFMKTTPSLLQSRIAAMTLFFCSGFVFASWGVHIPTIKDKFGLGEAALSIAMLAVAFGAVIAMRSIGRISAKLGSAKTSLLSGLLLALGVALILLMPSYTSLVIWLLLFVPPMQRWM